MNKKQLIQRIEEQIKKCDIVMATSMHSSRVRSHEIAKSNYYIALATLVAAPTDIYDSDDDSLGGI